MDIEHDELNSSKHSILSVYTCEKAQHHRNDIDESDETMRKNSIVTIIMMNEMFFDEQSERCSVDRVKFTA